MTLNMFDQFESPQMYYVHLCTLAIILPPIFYVITTGRLLENRQVTMKIWLAIQFVRDVFSPVNLGGYKWAPLFLALFLFLITMNTLGLLPYTFTPTTQFSLNMALAFPLWLSTVLIGFRSQLNESLAHLLPLSTPGPLVPLLVLIETVSLLMRPLALGVRITANLTAGHLLIGLMATGVWSLLQMLPPIAVLTMILMFFLSLLEMAVALIQAYVFLLLLSLYLQENV
uniref:ATP synthase F0 subunit 6 n=1 Tax=Tentoriceps cristatus TaxID=1183399 RepID=UPI0023AA4E35|nr:ATP synthase F0 subunit 6 [Tentoriceps cristatus]WCP19594.1 ATP synthase F0 subunit 6 [Tentoriceps cristatus]